MPIIQPKGAELSGLTQPILLYALFCGRVIGPRLTANVASPPLEGRLVSKADVVRARFRTSGPF